MKKFISILLAVLMMFTIATTAFAGDDDPATSPDTSETGGNNNTQEPGNNDDTQTPDNQEDASDDEGGLNDLLDTIKDMPVWEVKAGAKVAKIFAKLAKAFLKVAMAFGIIKKADVFQMIKNLF